MTARDKAMARAYWSTAFTMAEIGTYFGVGYSTVSRAVHRYASEAELWLGDEGARPQNEEMDGLV
jgi:transposase